MEIVARKVIAIFLKLLGRKTFDTVEQGVSTVVHQWFGGSKLHNPLTRFANRLGFRACFVAGTPIRTPDGSKPIEEFKSFEEVGEDCDYVLARSEFDPNGPVRARRVLRKFVRVAPVLNLHVGGRVIGTTAEHPFFVEDKGWTPAFDLRIGDRVLLEDGKCLRVEGVADSGRVETVYNIEVENDHTYFVGEQNWGWAVWSHNTVCESVVKGLGDVKDSPFVSNVLNTIKKAATQAKSYVEGLTHSSPFSDTSGRINLYINLLKAKAGMPLNKLPQSVQDIVSYYTKSGVVEWHKFMPRFRGSAIMAKTRAIVEVHPNMEKLIQLKQLVIEKGSRLRVINTATGRVRIPDFQLQLSRKKWAIFELTTPGQQRKIMKYDHRLSPWLINLLH